MQEQFETIDLGEMMGAVRSKLALIICFTLISAAAAFLTSSFLIPERYQSDALLIVNASDSSSGGITNDQITSAKQLVDTYSVILTSSSVLDQVIEDLQLRELEGFEDATAADLAEDVVRVEQVGTTQILKVSAVTENRSLSSDIVAEILKAAPDIIIKTVKAGSVEVISGPVPQEAKVYPTVPGITAAAAFAAFLLCSAVAVAIKRADRTFKTGEDITKRLGLPVLGVIPESGR